MRVRGHPVRSATFIKRSDALNWGIEKEADLRLNKHFPNTSKNGKRTLGELIDRYLYQILPEKKT